MKNIFNKIYSFFNNINQKYKNLFNTKLKYILQFFPSNLYILILFITLLFIVTPKILNNETYIYSTNYGTVVPNEIVKKSIYQEIHTEDISKIDDLAIKFSTYQRKNNSTYEVIVYENEKIIFKEKLYTKLLKDNEYKNFKVNHKVDKDKAYKFEVKPIKVKKGNGITITKDDNGNYVYRLCEKSKFYKECIVLSIIFLLILFFINYLINNGKIKSEENFYKIMIIYFILITFIFPPLFEPDSGYHFDRAYTISQKNIYEFVTSDNFSRGKIPSNIDCLEYGNSNYVMNEVTNYEGITKCFDSKGLVKQKGKLNISNKIAFAFSGLGIKLARLFTNSPMILFYTGRLFNTLVSFFIMLFALKIAPKHKRILLSIVMIPVFLQQMCSYSYDSILNSLCILIIAYLLKFFNEKDTIRKRDLLIYAISVMFVLQIKLPYVLVGMPIIFVDKKKFGIKKYSKILYLFIMLILLGLAFIIPKIGGSLSVVDTSGSGERGMSLESLFNIKYTLRLIYNTARINIWYYLESFIGGLAWLNQTYISKLFIYFYLIFICFGIASEEQSVEMKKIYKILIVLINIVLLGGIFLAMYLAWTMPESKVIDGVQGRYLYAPILGILLCLIPKKKIIDISNETFYSFFNISCFIYLITMLYLFY